MELGQGRPVHQRLRPRLHDLGHHVPALSLDAASDSEQHELLWAGYGGCLCRGVWAVGWEGEKALASTESYFS